MHAMSMNRRWHTSVQNERSKAKKLAEDPSVPIRARHAAQTFTPDTTCPCGTLAASASPDSRPFGVGSVCHTTRDGAGAGAGGVSGGDGTGVG